MALFLPATTPALDSNGAPMSGAVWSFYYQNTLTAASPTSVTANASGVFADTTLNDAISYRAVLRSSAGKVLLDIPTVIDDLFVAAVKSAMDENDRIASGAYWRFTSSNSGGQRAVYADAALETSFGDVVQSDAAGRFPNIYLDDSVTYCATLYDADGNQITQIDPVTQAAMHAFLNPAALIELEPGASWNGTAASGFSTTPTDPTRTTAKPAMRLIVPPNQAFTDTLLVGVYAAANDGGSLWHNMGLEKVRVYYEGSVLDIRQPTYQTFNDANGNPVTYFGWWVKLKHNGTNGVARLYWEAVPRDSTMQSRVTGPFTFLPSATLYDYDITWSESQPEVAGSNYQTLAAALTYLKSVSAQHPRITITEPESDVDLDVGVVIGGYTGANGYCTIESTAPVTFGKPSFTSDTVNIFRPKYDGLRFKGSNLTFDWANVAELRQEDVHTVRYWLDGVTFIVSGGGRERRWRKGRRPVAWTVRNPAYFTECDISGLSNPCFNAQLVRGCYFHEGHNDCVSESRCVIGNVTNDWDSVAAGLFVDVPAMTVTYTGSEATASLSLSGGSAATNRTFTARWGANSSTFAISGSQVAYDAGTNYDVSDVVNWLNGLGVGFTATLLDDTRQAVALALPNTKGVAFTNANCKDTTLSLVTVFDSHGDWYAQTNTDLTTENAIIADNKIYGMRGQSLFLAGDYGARDYIVVNNSWYNKLDPSGGYAENASTFSQMNWSQSHVVIVHNTWASQGFNFKTAAGYNGDAYCLLANNSVRRINFLNDPDTDVVIADNHIQEIAAASEPVTAVRTTVGGDDVTLYASAITGDFTPAGALLTNLKTPIVKYDALGNLRGATAAVGAVA